MQSYNGSMCQIVCACHTDVSASDTAEFRQRVTALSDSLTMSLIIGVDLTCAKLCQLTEQLRVAVKQLHFLVPDSVYLPAPPVYCPLPAITVKVIVIFFALGSSRS